MKNSIFSEVQKLYSSQKNIAEEIASLPSKSKGNPNKLKDLVKISHQIHLQGCAFHLLEWIYKQCHSYGATEFLLDLKKFAKQTAKDRHNKKPYAPKTLKEALVKIESRSQGLVQVFETHHWSLHTIIVRPLTFFERDTSPNSSHNPEAANAKLPSTADHSKNADWQQQQLKKQQRERFISKAKSIFNQELKLKLDERTLRKLSYWSNSQLDLIQKGYEWLITRYSTAVKAGETIENAAGYLIQGFRYGWFTDFDPCYEPEIPICGSMAEVLSHSRRLFA